MCDLDFHVLFSVIQCDFQEVSKWVVTPETCHAIAHSICLIV